jgi:dTDP-4-amino-4,6-dideoxygalactose transaminase
MAALLLNLKPGDEVIVPSFTFVSTASAFARSGAVPVFVDSRPDTFNIDERKVEGAITSKTRAIVVVHYAGVACEMNALMEISERFRVPLIEDNAHGLMGEYHGKRLGAFGSLSTLSFHETKNITCGEGGALLIQDPSFLSRAEILRDKGTNRSAFFKGEVDKYTWVEVGSSFPLSELNAAFLKAQLENIETIQGKRKTLWERYHQELKSWAEGAGVQQPVIPAGVKPSFHLYSLVLPSAEVRTRFIRWLKDQGVHAVFHYVPLHLSPVGRRYCPQAALPVCEDFSDRLVRLPFYTSMNSREQTTVIEAVLRFRI